MNPFKYKSQAWLLSCGALLMLVMQSSSAYDLLQVYQSALEKDPTYLSVQTQLKVRQAQLEISQAALKPNIFLAGAASREYVEGRLGNTQATTLKGSNSPATLGVTLKIPLLELNKSLISKQAKTAVRASEVEVVQAKQELRARVISTYFSAWLASQKYQYALQQQKAAQRQFEIARKYYQVGKTTVIDVEEARANYFSIRANSIQLQSQADIAWSALESLVGEKITEPLAAPGPRFNHLMRVNSSLEDWLEAGKRNNLSLVIGRIGNRGAQLEVDQANALRYPVVNVTGAAGVAGSWFEDQYFQVNQSRSIGLEVTVPLYQGGAISGKVKEAYAKKLQSRENINLIEQMVLQNIKSSYNQAVAGLATLEAYEAAQIAAKSSVQANQLGYEKGVRINIDILNAQNNLNTIQSAFSQAQFATLMGNVNLKSLVGNLSDDDIFYINQLLVIPNGFVKKQSDLPSNLTETASPPNGTVQPQSSVHRVTVSASKAVATHPTNSSAQSVLGGLVARPYPPADRPTSNAPKVALPPKKGFLSSLFSKNKPQPKSMNNNALSRSVNQNKTNPQSQSAATRGVTILIRPPIPTTAIQTQTQTQIKIRQQEPNMVLRPTTTIILPKGSNEFVQNENTSGVYKNPTGQKKMSTGNKVLKWFKKK